MAFARSGLSRVGGSGGGSVWLYATTEGVAAVLGANFFLPAKDEINVGDVVLVVDAVDFTVSFCVANNGSTTVTMASGTAIGNS
jgi:hypothetical protein